MDKLFNSFKIPNWNQPNPNPIMIERCDPLSGATPKDRARWKKKRPVPQEIETRSFHEEAVRHDRTGTPIVGRDTNH